MDPNTNLQEQRRLAALIQAQHDAGQDTSTDAARLAELVITLDAWITKGGFLPSDWH